MEPHDLDHLVSEESESLGLPPEVGRQDPIAPDDLLGASLGEILEQAQPGRPADADQEAAAREIELAIDALRPRHPFDLPMRPEYIFDPDYTPDRTVLVLSWPMPHPLFGPYPDW